MIRKRTIWIRNNFKRKYFFLYKKSENVDDNIRIGEHENDCKWIKIFFCLENCDHYDGDEFFDLFLNKRENDHLYQHLLLCSLLNGNNDVDTNNNILHPKQV